MKELKKSANRFAVCINNADYPASLELHKIYRVLPASMQQRRVISE